MAVIPLPFTGAAQTWTVPAGVTQVLIECWGAGNGVECGGYAAALRAVTPGESLQVNVGGSNRFNGGGAVGLAGGGATDVRQGGTTLAKRVVVAGGAGGPGIGFPGVVRLPGGAGGADVGAPGSDAGSGCGGTQTAGGAGGVNPGWTAGSAGTLGVGGSSVGGNAGAGGGGYYGGGGGAGDGFSSGAGKPGGGGSNFGGSYANQRGISSPDGSSNGYARITWGELVATVDAASNPPRVALEAVGVPGATLTVTGVHADGTQHAVRTANPGQIVGGGWAGFDYELPYGLAVTYTATSDTGWTGTASVPALREYGVQTPWLIHPGDPALSQPLSGVTIGDDTVDVNQAAHVILGREDPVVIGDGVRHLPTFPLTVKTFTTADELALGDLLADGSALLLQVLFPFTDLCEYRWVSIGQYTKSRVTLDFGEPYKLWTLPCTETSAPAGLQQSERVYSDLLGDFASYADADAAYATYSDLLLGRRIGA